MRWLIDAKLLIDILVGHLMAEDLLNLEPGLGEEKFLVKRDDPSPRVPVGELL